MPDVTLHPELHGARFNNAQVPVDVLKDLAALQELLIEAAKREYLAIHGRRVPRGFGKNLELRLTSIEEGSAKLSLLLVGISAFTHNSYFRTASDKIINSIASVANGAAPQVAPDLLCYFGRFGKSLKPGESIRWTRPDGGTTSLTPEVRQQLIEASHADEWRDPVALKGRVSAADFSAGTFALELKDGTKLRNVPLDDKYISIVLDALKGYKNKRKVAVTALVLKDNLHNSKRVEYVEHMSLVDPLDVETRLDELATLKDHWLDGKGVALDKAGLTLLSEAFEGSFSSDLPLPYLYPTPEGGVLAEWSIGDWAVSLDINLSLQTAEYQALNLKTNECHEEDLSLGNSEGWHILNSLLKQLGSPTAA